MLLISVVTEGIHCVQFAPFKEIQEENYFSFALRNFFQSILYEDEWCVYLGFIVQILIANYP